MKMPFVRNLFTICLLMLSCICYGNEADSTCYELRIYNCFDGRLPALQKRFREHTLALFEKHGIKNIGYWLPLHDEPNTLYYIIAYPNRRSRDSMWNAFAQSAEWLEAKRRSEEDGKIVDKVTSVFMFLPPASPRIQGFHNGRDHIFELKTYTCASGGCKELLDGLGSPGRKTLESQGIKTVAFWLTYPSDSNASKLVYLFAHPDEAAAKRSWKTVQQKAGGKQWANAGAESTEVHSVWLTPLGFSKIR